MPVHPKLEKLKITCKSDLKTYAVSVYKRKHHSEYENVPRLKTQKARRVWQLTSSRGQHEYRGLTSSGDKKQHPMRTCGVACEIHQGKDCRALTSLNRGGCRAATKARSRSAIHLARLTRQLSNECKGNQQERNVRRVRGVSKAYASTRTCTSTCAHRCTRTCHMHIRT